MVWRVLRITAMVILGIVVAFILFEVGAYLGDLTHTGPLPVIIIAAVVILIVYRVRRNRAKN